MVEKVRINDVVRMLPRTMQKRFDSLGGFVTSVANAPDTEKVPLSSEQLQFIQFAALIYALDNFLRLGTNAARSAASAFETLGSPAFAVGTTVFTKNNAATMRGAKLADALKAALRGTKLLQLIKSASSMRELVEDLARRLRNGEDMG